MDRINWLYHACALPVSLYFKTFKKVYYEGKLPSNGPCLYLSKHQAQSDITINNCFILETVHRPAYTLMRRFSPFFNFFYECLGGITVARGRDVKRGRYTSEQATQLNEKALQRAINALKAKEILIAYPEGTRRHKKMGKLRITPDTILGKIIEAQKEIGDISIVSGGIEYNHTHINLRVGKPFYTRSTSELEARLSKEIPALSGL